jgi:hypothetical protein
MRPLRSHAAVAHMASPCYAWQPQAHGVGCTCQSTSEHIQCSGHTTVPSYTYNSKHKNNRHTCSNYVITRLHSKHRPEIVIQHATTTHPGSRHVLRSYPNNKRTKGTQTQTEGSSRIVCPCRLCIR